MRWEEKIGKRKDKGKNYKIKSMDGSKEKGNVVKVGREKTKGR